MKNFKKFLTLVLAVMMVVSSVAFSTSAATTKFEDVDASNEALVKAVDLLNYVGVAKGTSETTFGADELVTRQQFALFIYRLMKGGKDAPAAGNTTKFTDLEDNTYNFAIAWAVNEGIVTGRTTTTFAPKDPIKLQEAYAMVTRALGYEDEEALVYPFGHIDAAEKEGVELDANLAADLDYTDELTRGDMAIILYNAFFANTAEEKVEVKLEAVYKKDANGNETNDVASYQYKETTTHKSLCEEVFDVVEVELQAIATPNAYVVGKANEATYKLDNDSAVFVAVANSDLNTTAGLAAGAQYYLTAEDLGLDAEELDEYAYGVFSMFVRLDKEKKIEKVLFADCNMVKKTVTDLKLGTVSSNKKDSYYDKDADAKILSGKLTADGVDMYLFDAPYTYISPDYSKAVTKDDAGYYAARNANNLKKIEVTVSKIDEEYITKIDAKSYVVPSAYTQFVNGVNKAASDAALSEYEMVYYGGLYEADLYDVEGDGIYDYIDYKPYKVFQLDTDAKKKTLTKANVNPTDIGKSAGLEYWYVGDATVLGEEFEDEDVVIGYVNKDANLVKVVAVVEPTVDTIDNYKASGTLVLGSGETIDGAGRWALLNQYKPAAKVYDADKYTMGLVETGAYPWFSASVIDNEKEVELYVYNGVLLFSGDITANAKFEGNLIIPTELNGQKTWNAGSFDPDADKQVSYVYAWVDGETKYVKVAYDKDLSLNIVGANGAFNYADFRDKLCTYTVSDGVYTILPLDKTVKDNNVEINKALSQVVTDLGTSKTDKGDEGAQIMQAYAANATLIKDNGTRFNLMAYVDANTTPTQNLFARDLVLSADTQMIIQVRDTKNTADPADDDYKYEVYNSENFTKSLDKETFLKNVTIIVANNTDSYTREDLVLLYATTDSLEFKGVTDKSGYRIVADNELDKDENGDWRIFYNVYNPFTGAKESKIASWESEDTAASIKSYAVAAGTIVKLYDGMVRKSYATNQVLSVNDVAAKKLAWITEVDTKENYFTVVPYASGIANDEAADAYVIANEKAHIFDIFGEEIKSNVIGYDNDTVVAVMSRESYDANFWKWTGMNASSIEAIAELDESVLCYNSDVLEDNEYVTKFANYVKAYIAVDENNPKEDEIPVAEFIIVIVNDGETAAVEAPEANA